jgi:hypothetical protein
MAIAQGPSRLAGEPSRPTPAGSSAPAEAARKSAARADQIATPPVVRLDPGLVERLADDVIRLIDRRARIERARHGI